MRVRVCHCWFRWGGDRRFPFGAPFVKDHILRDGAGRSRRPKRRAGGKFVLCPRLLFGSLRMRAFQHPRLCVLARGGTGCVVCSGAGAFRARECSAFVVGQWTIFRSRVSTFSAWPFLSVMV